MPGEVKLLLRSTYLGIDHLDGVLGSYADTAFYRTRAGGLRPGTQHVSTKQG
jgi:hypothetical protein